MTLLLYQAGLNLVQKTSQRDDTKAVSDWFEPRPEDKSKRWHCCCVRLVWTSSRRQVKEMTLLLCQAGLNLVQKTSQRDDTVAVSGWFEPRPEDKSNRWHCCCVRLVWTTSRRQVKEMTLLLCQTGINLVQKTSQRDDTVVVSGWFEPRPEDKSKRWQCCCVRLVWTSSRRQVKDMTLLLCQAGLNLVQKTSQRDNTVAVSDWYEPRPEDKSKRWHWCCVRLVWTSSRRQVKEMTLSLCQAGLNLVQKISQRDDTVAVSGWFEPRPEDKSKIWHCCCVRLVWTSSRRQVKEMTLLLCQAGINLVQKTSQRDDTVAMSDWYEPCPEDKSKRWHCCYARLVWTSSRRQVKDMAL